MAFKALLANKMRSLLTMLGIIIGVGAVIVMVALGTGVKESITNSIASLGSNMLIVSPAATNNGGVRGAAGSNTKLKYDDAKAIKDRIKNIDYVSPSVASSYQIVNGRSNWNSSVQGVTPEYMAIRSLEVVSGSYISINDMDKRNRVQEDMIRAYTDSVISFLALFKRKISRVAISLCVNNTDQ